MKVLGLIFAGTATERRDEMAQFVREVLSLEPVDVEGAQADMFRLTDGSIFAVSGPREMGETSRTLGLEVADLDEAVAQLRAAGVEVGETAENAAFRYAHFRPPDGHLYELVQRRP